MRKRLTDFSIGGREAPVPVEVRRDADSRPAPVGCRVSMGGRLALVGLAMLLGAGFLLARAVEPDDRGYGTHERFGLPPCSFQVAFGIPCPSCGSTTSFAYFVRGAWGAALRSNLSAFGLAVTSLVVIPWSLWSAACGRTWRVESPEWLALGVIAVLCAAAIVDWIQKMATQLPF